MDNHSDSDLTRKNARTGLIVLAVVIGMIGLSFASVPLYRLFCQVTGFGGTTMVSKDLPGTILDRTITIHFNADVSRSMPWTFKPEQRSVEVKLGERGLTAFMAYNKADVPVTGTAIYNVTPLKAGKYFHKIQCFCFDAQTLQPGERVDMPVVFFVDPALNDDPNLSDVKTITLSYSFFPADSKELEEAMQAFYNSEEFAKKPAP